MSMANIKILLVEDNALIALQLKMFLARAGYDVLDPVVRGSDAIAIARQENPNVILMDIRLIGEMDGIETAQRIREFSQARIIFATGHSDRDYKQRADALNPIAYLVKPVDVREIIAIITQASDG